MISKCRLVAPGPSAAAAKEGAQREPFSIPLQSPQREEELAAGGLSLPAAVPSKPSLAHGVGSGAQLLLAVRERAACSGGRQCLYSLCRVSFPSLITPWARGVCSEDGLMLGPSGPSSSPGAETKFEQFLCKNKQKIIKQHLPGGTLSDDLLSGFKIVPSMAPKRHVSC